MKTSLYRHHIQLSAKMVDFAGFEMPIHYEKGINYECSAVRSDVGIFDVSHMGQILINGEKAFEFVQYITTNDVSKLSPGQCQYTVICDQEGGIIDDLILYCMNDGYLLVVNASNIKKDFEWIKNQQIDKVEITDLSKEISLVAIQGPKSRDILNNIDDFKNHISDLGFYNFIDISDNHGLKIISRTGYTGELGFEIYGNHDFINSIWSLLVDNYSVNPIGLGARDILRMEMRYLLYGNDMDNKITPYECGLGWIVAGAKGDFIGRDAMFNVKKSMDKKLVGFLMNDRCVPRPGYPIVSNGNDVGYVTSGTFSSVLGHGIGMGYVKCSDINNDIFIKVRDKEFSCSLIKGPFIKGSSLFE